MVFNPNIPQPTDFLSNSQSDLLTNNSQLDIVFGIDHYKYSDVSGNKGKHNYVTTPQAVNVPPTASGHPDTTSTELKFYAMQDSANIGLLQYSRGWDAANSIPAQPSPVTYLQGPIAAQALGLTAGSQINILDFAGIGDYALLKLYVYNSSTAINRQYYYEGSVSYKSGTGIIVNEVASTLPTTVRVNSSGTVLRIFRNSDQGAPNNFADAVWTIQFLRIKAL